MTFWLLGRARNEEGENVEFESFILCCLDFSKNEKPTEPGFDVHLCLKWWKFKVWNFNGLFALIGLRIDRSIGTWITLFTGEYICCSQKKNYNQVKRRMNSRTSMAQREEIIRRTVYVSDIDQQVINISPDISYCHHSSDFFCGGCLYDFCILMDWSFSFFL